MQPIDPSGRYGPEAVTAALRGATGTRVLDFRYDRLAADGRWLGTLTNVISGSVAYDSLADIKRTAKFVLSDDGGIDYLSDRIRPWVRLRMPDGGWVEWPQGVFLLSTPSRVLSPTGLTTRSVDAYDQLVVLKSDQVADRYTVVAGTLYTDAVRTIAAGLVFNITPSGKGLPTTMEWEPGTARLTILNDLLGAINYRAAWFDENGTLICQPYVAPDTVTPGFTYATDDRSVIRDDVTDTLDLFAVPNRWVLVKSNPEEDALVAVYTNTAITSPTSTVARGRVITDFRTEQDAADQATLDAKAARLAFEASQVFEQVELQTALMPMHSHADVLGVVVNGLGLTTAKWSETSWSYDLKVGATMKHSLRRTVSVS